MKHLLFAAYIFSVLYCYLQLNAMIDRAIEIFKERHPAIPVGDAPFAKGLELGLEILGVSAVPFFNLFIGYLASSVGEDGISEIVDSVEMKHYKEITEVENDLKGKIDWEHYY